MIAHSREAIQRSLRILNESTRLASCPVTHDRDRRFEHYASGSVENRRAVGPKKLPLQRLQRTSHPLIIGPRLCIGAGGRDRFVSRLKGEEQWIGPANSNIQTKQSAIYCKASEILPTKKSASKCSNGTGTKRP